ncbi:MAG: GNAT family N-acetyltransferase [Candidatus Azobacteroides sp.]|nr:GNAT family N-acetyltransferase [Candidatus Azobacteroides sp.]
MKELLIEKIGHSEINEVAGILTDAFKTNPAYSIIFKNKNRSEEGLLWLFKASLTLNNYKQILTRVIKEKDTGKIIGTFTLIPPGVKNGIAIYSKIGIPCFISKFGLKSFVRILGLDDCNKSSLTKSMETSEYYYLSMVVVRKEYRGMGIGSYAIQYIIQELISSNPVCGLIGLTTQLPENVTFYSRLGFEKLDEGFIDFKGDRYYNYNMKLNIPSNPLKR